MTELEGRSGKMTHHGSERLPEAPGTRGTSRERAELVEGSLPGVPSSLPVPRPPAPGWPGPEPRREYARPRSAERFKCIASACEDTCCQGWSVPIDRGTYEKYRSSDAMKPHLGTLIVLNTERPTNLDYARIPLKADATCGFLDEQKLCGIQKQLGAGMLSVTCATYPRAVSTQAGEKEEALNLSCPEAARLTLLDVDLLSDGPWHASGAARYAAVRFAATQPAAQANPRLAIREYAVLLVGDRSYPLWQRLHLLGLLVRRLESLSEGGASLGAWCDANAGKVANALAASARDTALGRLRPLMQGVEEQAGAQPWAQPGAQLELTVHLLQLRGSSPFPARFVECLQDFESGLGCAANRSEKEIVASYVGASELYYRPLLERHPYLLENYLVNQIFKNGYPFGRPARQPDAVGEHLLLCGQAAMVQTLLIGMAAHHRRAFGVEHVVKLVQSLARTIEHSQQALDQIRETMLGRHLNNAPGMALLLKVPEAQKASPESEPTYKGRRVPVMTLTSEPSARRTLAGAASFSDAKAGP